MHLLCMLLLLSACQPNNQVAPSAVILSTSRTNPYVGEVIELILTIRSQAATTPLDLSIPGMSSFEAWAFLDDQKAAQNKGTQSNALPLRFRHTLINAPLVKPGEYQLRWRMPVRSSSNDENVILRIGPVRVGQTASNSLSLEVQRPPPQPPTNTAWDLGVGDFRVSASWLPAEVALGEETTLRLAVDGNGSLHSIGSPPLHTLPGWERDRFLLESQPAFWQGQQRIFTFRVRPRQLRTSIPPLFIRFFDPIRGAAVTQKVVIPPLHVLAAKGMQNVPSGSTIADALNHLPEFRRHDLEQQTSLPWARWINWLLWAPLALAGFILVNEAVRRFAPGWLEQLRWRKASREAQLAVKVSDGSPKDIRRILAQYLSTGLERAIPADWNTLSIAAPLSPALLQPMLDQIQLLEFGPHTEEAEQQFQLLSQHLFSQQEQV